MNKLFSLFLFIATISLINCELCARLGRHILQHQCVLTPEGTEGPYYLPYHLVRSDIRENRPGLQFKLKFKVTDITKCEPMKNVTIDIWQADALGTYSSYTKNLPTTVPKSVLHADPTDNTTFLRGVQITDDNGEVEFMTVFPGKFPAISSLFLKILLYLFFPPHSIQRTICISYTTYTSAGTCKRYNRTCSSIIF